jgi:hypothetical protein
MARKHTKLGYSHGDVIDRSVWNEAAFARRSRRQPIFTHLNAAAFYRRRAGHPATSSLGAFYRREDYVHWALIELNKARQWRLEIGG